MNLILVPLIRPVNVGSPATFTCTLSSTPNNNSVVDIHWLINGTSQEDFDEDEIKTNLARPYIIGTLEFSAAQKKHNRTTVRCQVQFSSGLTANSTSDGLLLVFG